MNRIKIEDIFFWILIAAIVGIAIWLLSGSPTETSALVGIALFVSTSELFLWRKFFNLDKKTAIGFVKVGSDLREIKNDLNGKHNEIKNEFINMKYGFADIKNLIKKK